MLQIYMEDIYDHFSPRLSKITIKRNYVMHAIYIIIIIIVIWILYKFGCPMLKKLYSNKKTYKKRYDPSHKTNIHSLIKYNAAHEATSNFPFPINTN